MAHLSDFKQLTLPSAAGGPVATGIVRPDGAVDWIHVWILQPQGSTFATAVGFWGVPSQDAEWTVHTELQPGSAAFAKGPALALAIASMSTVAADGTRESTVLHWTQTVSIE